MAIIRKVASFPSQLLMMAGMLCSAAYLGGMLFDFFVNERLFFQRYPESLQFVRSYWIAAQPGMFFRTTMLLQFLFYVPALALLWSTGNNRKRNLLILGLGLIGACQWWNMYYFVPQNELIRMGSSDQIEAEVRGFVKPFQYTTYSNGYAAPFTQRAAPVEEVRSSYVKPTVDGARVYEEIPIFGGIQQVERERVLKEPNNGQQKIQQQDIKINRAAPMEQDFHTMTRLPYTPLPMSRFLANLIKLGLMSAGILSILGAMAIPTASDSLFGGFLKGFVTNDLWNKLTDKDKKKLRKFVSPSLWDDWSNSYSSRDRYRDRAVESESESDEDNGPGFTDKLKAKAKKMGRKVKGMAHGMTENVGQLASSVNQKGSNMGNKLAEGAQQAWRGAKHSLDTEPTERTLTEQQYRDQTYFGPQQHGEIAMTRERIPERSYNQQFRPSVISKLKSMIPGTQEYSTEQDIHPPTYFNQRDDVVDRSYDYRPSKTEQLKQGAKEVAHNIADKVSDLTNQTQSGRNRGSTKTNPSTKLDAKVAKTASKDTAKQQPIKHVIEKEQTIVVQKVPSDERIQNNLTHDVGTVDKIQGSRRKKAPKAEEQMKITKRIDIQAPGTPVTTIPVQINKDATLNSDLSSEKRRDIEGNVINPSLLKAQTKSSINDVQSSYVAHPYKTEVSTD